MEKLFCLCHNEYSLNTINKTIIAIEPELILRNAIAEAYGYISKNHFDLIIEKIRQIFQCMIL